MSLAARAKSPLLGAFDDVPGGLEACFTFLFTVQSCSGPYEHGSGVRGTLFSKERLVIKVHGTAVLLTAVPSLVHGMATLAIPYGQESLQLPFISIFYYILYAVGAVVLAEKVGTIRQAVHDPSETDRSLGDGRSSTF